MTSLVARFLKHAGQTTLATTIILAGLAGCEPAAEDIASEEDPLRLSQNGLNTINGINTLNGFNTINGFNSLNGLNTLNGLSSYNGLMTTDGGRQTVAYLVRCALPTGRTLVKQDQNGVSHSFPGQLGLAPEYEAGACGSDCKMWLSACMLAHVNTAGNQVPLFLVGQHSALGWGQSAEYPNQEGTFFGNIFDRNTAGKIDAYYCNGPGFDKSVVEGRIGSNQAGAPYRNMFASGFCNINGCLASDAKTNGVSDGYKQCVMGDGSMTAWNQLITVWRKNTAYNAAGQPIAGQSADGRSIRYDFEGTTNSWTSGNTQLVLSSVSTAGAQSGTRSLLATYNSGSSTLKVQSPTVSLPAGTKVTFYLYLAADSRLTSINPFVKKQGGGADFKVTNPVANVLKGSWNAVTITVPAGSTGIQVGVEFQTSGAFTANVDSVTW